MDNEKFLSPETILTPNEKEMIDMQFGDGAKLSMDYVNAYTSLKYWAESGNYSKIEPIPTYKEYFLKEGKNPNALPYILQLSDPEAAEALDNLVSDFNNKLEIIKEDEKIGIAKDFLIAIRELVEGKK